MVVGVCRGEETDVVEGKVVRITTGKVKVLPIKLELVPLGRDEAAARCRSSGEEGEREKGGE
jgi:hypothetical protein